MRGSAKLWAGALLFGFVLASPSWAAIVLNEPGYTDVAVGTLPGGNPNAFGAVAGVGGTVYSTGAFSGNGLYSITGGVTTPLTNFPDSALGLQVIGNTAYVSLEGGAIYSVDLSNSSTNLVGASGMSTPMALAVAPAGFGSFGGDLIVSGIGAIYAFNPMTAVSTPIVLSGGFYSSIAFANDGTLLATDYSSNTIVSVLANGTVTPFASAFSPAGIAVNPLSGDVYVAAEGTNTIEHYLSDGTYVGTFASNVNWDGGYYPSMLSFTQDGSALIYGQFFVTDPDFGIREITGFGVSAVPEPSTLVSAAFATLAGMVAVRRRRRAVTAR